MSNCLEKEGKEVPMLILHVMDGLQISGTKYPLGGAVVAGSDRSPIPFLFLSCAL